MAILHKYPGFISVSEFLIWESPKKLTMENEWPSGFMFLKLGVGLIWELGKLDLKMVYTMEAFLLL